MNAPKGKYWEAFKVKYGRYPGEPKPEKPLTFTQLREKAYKRLVGEGHITSSFADSLRADLVPTPESAYQKYQQKRAEAQDRRIASQDSTVNVAQQRLLKSGTLTQEDIDFATIGMKKAPEQTEKQRVDLENAKALLQKRIEGKSTAEKLLILKEFTVLTEDNKPFYPLFYDWAQREVEKLTGKPTQTQSRENLLKMQGF